MGKSSRAYRFREVKGQRRELLISAEKRIDGLDKHESAVQAALERAAAAPPVPVVLKGATARAAAAAMEVDDSQALPSGGKAKEEDGNARMRRVLAVTAFPAFKKRGGSKGKGGGVPVHPEPSQLRKLKKALKRGANI